MEPTKRCPYCGELILRIAIRCKHCQADLRGETDLAPAPLAPTPPPAVLSTAAPVASPAAPPVMPPDVVEAPAALSLADANARAAAPGPAARAGYVAPTEGTFEQRFLDFAFKTNLPINPATVAYALKIPIDEANEGLEDLAVRDVLLREVDPRGVVNYTLPGRTAVAAVTGVAAVGPVPSTALSPYAQPPQLLYDPPGALIPANENTALAGLLVNVCFPGLGSLIGGRTSAGVFQLLMFLAGFPLCFFAIGFPMVIGAWLWGLVTGVNMLNEAKQGAQQRRTLAG